MKKNLLCVCWMKPETNPCEDTFLLSFLSPSVEESLSSVWHEKIISGRQVAQQIKDQAIALYVDIVAKIPLTRGKQGKALRESLKTKDGNNLWWYHRVSFKDCESDQTFNQIIQLLTIQKVVEEKEVKKIILWGADQSLLNVLKSSGYDLKGYFTRKSYFPIILKGMLSRFKYLIVNLIKWLALKKYVSIPHIKPDVVFSGFWDWSVKSNPVQNTLNDRYFKSLPNALIRKGLKVAWFLWFSPYSELESRNRRLKEVLSPARTHKNLLFLQKYLKIRDYISATLNFKPLYTYIYFRYQSSFKTLFEANGLDLFPLFSSHLLSHFSDHTLPHHWLISKASQRAFNNFKPKFALSFLELFPYSRAFYTGSRFGSPKTLHAAIQHASYSREKTFVCLDPEIEFNGVPDGCAVPKPDYIFTMGELGKDIFMESGFPEEKVFLTGSSRYEHIKNGNVIRDIRLGNIKNLLMVTSLDKNLEMEMIEAVFLATKDLQQIKLFLRSHPFAKMDEHPDFHVYKERIQVTNVELEEDLKKADLIVFSYSTVAEEALIRGIPVWQWLSASYNGSVFRDLRVIPSFTSVADLRETIKRFLQDPDFFRATEETKEIILRKCFYKADRRPSERIATILSSRFL